MTIDALAVIPARLASERLPGKPLQLLAGKPLIQRVYEAVQKTELFPEIIILTDSDEIKKAVEIFGGQVLMTSPDCQSGTDRILEVRDRLSREVIINVQGDEPFIDRRALADLLDLFSDEQVELASLMHKAGNFDELKSPNIVKVTVDQLNFALYFSRALIPYLRNPDDRKICPYYRHIGVYAYRNRILDTLASMKPGILERVEKLEQLRWLEYGQKIKMVETSYDGFGIDTKEDLERAEGRFAQL